jgi:hypothetical protein
LPWLLGDAKLTIPLTLGVVAAALADLDDRLTGRLRNLIITLISFLSPRHRSSFCFLALVICHWAYHVDHWVYFVGRAGATLRHHCVWRIAYRHLHHAWHHVIYRMVSAATFAAGGRHLV